MKNKRNWTVAIIFTTNSEANQLNKADIKYLENYCYQKALEAERYKLTQSIPTQSYVSEARKADLEDVFHSIFIPVVSSNNLSDQEEVFYLNARGSDAKAIYSKDGMTVLKGSKITALEPNKGFRRQNLLNQLILSGIINENGYFLKDYTFTAPSTGADIICKGSYNGWKVWKNNLGKTLDEVVERKNFD